MEINSVGDVEKRRCSGVSMTGDDEEDNIILNQLKAQSLEPFKEDLAEWLVRLLGPVGIRADNFIEQLDNGVLLCKLSDLTRTRAEHFKRQPPSKKITASKVPLQQLPTQQIPPELPQLPAKVKYRPEASSGSWFARDNTANFIEWCKLFGVRTDCLFETEGLVMHKEERNVILCLLELARLFIPFGIEPPNIIKMEKEIEQEEKSAGNARANRTSSAKPSEPSKKNLDILDKQVKLMCGNCTCQNSCNQIRRISEGRYNIGGKIVFIRLLQDRHLMVRVGGGWDSLQHYIAMHDPCKLKEIKKTSNSAEFLHVVGKYKIKDG